MSYNALLVRVALLMVSHTLVVPTEATFSQGFFKTVYLSQASFDAPDTKLGSAKMAKSDWSCRALCLEHNSEHVASGTNLAFVSSNNGVCGGIHFNAADASCQLISFKSLDLNLLSYNMGEIRCQALQLKSSCFHFTLTSQDPFRPDRDPCQFEGGKIAELKTLAQLNEAIGFLSGPGKNFKRVSIGLIANPVNVSDTSNLFWSSDRDTPVTIPDEQLYGTIDARKRCVALNNMGGSENFYAYSIRECETMTSLCQTCP